MCLAWVIHWDATERCSWAQVMDPVHRHVSARYSSSVSPVRTCKPQRIDLTLIHSKLVIYYRCKKPTSIDIFFSININNNKNYCEGQKSYEWFYRKYIFNSTYFLFHLRCMRGFPHDDSGLLICLEELVPGPARLPLTVYCMIQLSVCGRSGCRVQCSLWDELLQLSESVKILQLKIVLKRQ